MKNFLKVTMALALMAPTLAHAKPVAASLSLKNMAVQPARASTAIGKVNRMDDDDNRAIVPIILGLAAIAGIIIIAASGDGADSD